ncbi:hypothetical protein PoB_002216400 [Plakobranchus ocellatus]|uniref:Uncharacterized protein n=1 Tax=Plakobranchus ocellatus TaxID=259542 RepID=A0AAV3ZMP7_9GAST|nr:hypothetical protein PoB_002216400 [Plakobranchus ocellatus]
MENFSGTLAELNETAPGPESPSPPPPRFSLLKSEDLTLSCYVSVCSNVISNVNIEAHNSVHVWLWFFALVLSSPTNGSSGQCLECELHMTCTGEGDGCSRPQTGQGAGKGARIRDGWVPADIRADSLSTISPTLYESRARKFRSYKKGHSELHARRENPRVQGVTELGWIWYLQVLR